jgi:hypothetical protein
MTRVVAVLVGFAVLMGLASCGGSGSEPTLDCSTPQTCAESTMRMLQQLTESATPEEQQAFSSGMFKITMEFNNSGEDIEVLKKYQGWTITQVMDHGK